jgi:hypothetical protein
VNIMPPVDLVGLILAVAALLRAIAEVIKVWRNRPPGGPHAMA